MVELSGRCLCGVARWSYDGPRLRNLVCHCNDCQRSNAAPFSAFIGFDPEGLSWSGEVNHFESSPGCWRGFCPACGTRFYFKSEKWPGEIHVLAATLDNPADYTPDREVCSDERAPWLDQIGDLPTDGSFAKTPRV